MSKEKFALHRRAVLKGLGGLTLGLPLLEIMLDGKNAWAQAAPPMRYLVFFNGQSQGSDGDAGPSQMVPTTIGANYDLKSALLPLGALKSEVSVISGLKIPTAFENGGVVPSGGRRDDFHVSSLSPLLSGVKSNAGSSSSGETSDQTVAGFLAGPTAFKSLIYRVQADWYLSVSAAYGRDMISYKLDSTNKVVPIPPQTSPRQAFQALFGNFTPPGTDPAAAKKIDFDNRSRRSVLDLVIGDTTRLIPKLGASDKLRMQRHLDEIRQLEMRVAAIPPPQTSVCVKPNDPGADSGVGAPQGTNAAGDNTYTQNLGYSGEEERAKVFCDLIHMAMTCDLTRVASLQMTMFQSHLNMFNLTGQATDCHELGHGGVPGGSVAQAKGIAWHMKHFAYLVQKFKDSPEGNGNMLDNMAITSLWEGGHGFDPGANKQNSTHSTENMTVLLAGRAGGLKPGKHIVAAGKHPGNVLVTAMKAVGYTKNNLGEVIGDIPELKT